MTGLKIDFVSLKMTFTASVNFCEQDHLHSPYIVEYYNTLSSIPMIFLGIYGLYYHNKLHHHINYRFIILMLIGFGSTLFHATMHRFTQLLDEIPMIWLNSVLVYELIPSSYWFISAFFISIIYNLYHIYSIFIVYFTVSGLFVFFIPIQMRKNAFAKKLLTIALTLFTIGFIKWIIDNIFCSYVHDYYLHAWWHIWSGLSLYYYIQFQLAMKPHNIYSFFPLVVVKVIK